MNNLFTELENMNKQVPLAELLRPQTLEEFLGQSNVVAYNSPILNLLKTNRLFSLILWGTPGCGKTTLARLIATKTNANFIEISAVTSGVKDIKEAVEKAQEYLRTGVKTILFIDEIHRYSKTQQDALLPHLENGTLFLIGSTTENPSFQVVPALLSRVQVIRLNSIDDDSMQSIIKKGFAYLAKNHLPMDCESGVIDFIINLARGDARYALDLLKNAGELAFDEASEKVTSDHVKRAKERIEHNKVSEILSTLPLQQQRLLLAILTLTKQKEEITSGKLYESYTEISKKDAVTYRRIFDFINELELLGIISTNTISRGRGKGRTNIIKLQCDETLLETTLYTI
jgi:replication-associated recombination protein RarA